MAGKLSVPPHVTTCCSTSPPAARVAKSLKFRTFPPFLTFLEGGRWPALPFVSHLEALGSRTCNTFQTRVHSAPGLAFPGSLLRALFLVLYVSGVGGHPSTPLLTVSHPLTHLRNSAAVGNSWDPLTVWVVSEDIDGQAWFLFLPGPTNTCCLCSETRRKEVQVIADASNGLDFQSGHQISLTLSSASVAFGWHLMKLAQRIL